MLVDVFERPLRDLRISVTDRCNFRCGYCMPAEIYGEKYEYLPRKDLLTFEEITRLTRILVRLGVGKIRLTGGEPLLRKGIEELVRRLATIEGVEDLSLTTNASLLAGKARILRSAGLQRITVSLDSLDEKVFREMNGRGFSTENVLDGITAAVEAGFNPIKINAVVKRGVNDHTILDLARFSKERGAILRFIEYMDVGNRNDWKLEHVVSGEEILDGINAEFPIEPIEKNYPSEVASRFRYRDGEGEVGVITSVTRPFCGNCTRLRLSPEGKIYTCLFASDGTDLWGPLRHGNSDHEIEEIVRETWSRRTDRYSEERTSQTKPGRRKVEMYHIGG